MTTPVATPVTAIPFAKLVAVDAINARAATKEGLDELAASIAVKGLIQPLAVRPADGDKFEVIDGRRRYQALAKLVRDRVWKRTDMVPVLVRNEDDAEALETSLMANTVRLPMHPIDQHEVFARLAAQGKSEDEIAASFGIAARTVKQHLALGRLAPKVREAWKKGKIDAKVAQAFTMHEDQGVQEAAFDKLAKGRQLFEYAVRAELAAERVPVQRCAELRLVGEDAYLAAGGTLTESLFDEERFVDDMPLLRKLAVDRLHAERQRLLDMGWSWVLIDDEDLGMEAPFQTYDCDHVDGENGDSDLAPEDYTADAMRASGCVIGIGYDGEFRVQTGLLKPDGAPDDMSVPGAQTDLEDAIAAREAAEDDPDADLDGDAGESEDTDESDGDGGATISQALQQTVSEALTVATAKALAADPDLALRVITAALVCRHDAPAVVRNEGHVSVRARGEQTFVEAFRALLPASQEQVAGQFAAAVATTLDLTTVRWRYKSRDDGVATLRDALVGDLFLAAAREAFNGADYFKRASKAVALTALEEMADAGAIPALSPTLAEAKKDELVAAAVDAAQRTGWLPEQLRHPDYALAEPERVIVPASPARSRRAKG